METTTLTDEITARHGQFLTYAEAAAELRCSVRTIRREISDGRLPAWRIGNTRVLRVKAADVAALLGRS